MLRHVLKPVRDPQTTLTVLLPGAFAFEQRRLGFTHGGDRRLEACRQRLTGELVQQRLVIKGVEMAGAAFHEEEDHALGLGGTLWQRDGSRGALFTHQTGKCHSAKAAACGLQKFATSVGKIESIAAHGVSGGKRTRSCSKGPGRDHSWPDGRDHPPRRSWHPNPSKQAAKSVDPQNAR